MNKFFKLLLVALFVYPFNTVAQTPTAPQQETRSISDFLNPDGTFANPDGYQGAVDLAGFQMGSGEDGTPVFFSVDDDRWDLQSTYPGVNNIIRSIAVSGDDLYVGGGFTFAGGVSASRIARYDMTAGSWHTLSTGMNGPVYSLVVSGDDLYVGGLFTTAGGVSARSIARYNMTAGSWHALGSGVNASVYSLVVSGNDLFVGGEFTTAGGVSANRIARYDMTAGSWHTLGSGVNNIIRSLVVSGDDLYVGGQFTTAGDESASGIARYDMMAGSWHALGTGMNGAVFSLFVSGDDLYVGGFFTSVAGVASTSNIARYALTAGSWHALGTGVNGLVLSLAVSSDDLYVGGQFTLAGGETANRIARYAMTAGSWHALGTGVSNSVYSLAVSGDDLYVGGEFTSAEEEAANRIARYDITGTSWNALGSGLSSTVRSLVVTGDDLYVGGQFMNAGGVASASNIARYDLTEGSWHALGTGVNSTVFSLAVSGDDLYVGGAFTIAGGGSVSNIARYDMTNGSWHALGTGVNSAVWSLAVSGDDLYVGGLFTSAGGVASTSNIARYDLTNGSWHALGSGMNRAVLSMAVSGDDLFVGGVFTSAGGVGVGYIARYDMANGNWHALGTGVNNAVWSLVVSGNDLYVGGEFTIAGGVGAGYIARYDMANGGWHSMGSGVDNYVYNLALSGDDLYVGGLFTSAGGVVANRIARYDITGTSWHVLGSGVNGTVQSLVVTGDDLYVGGEFTSAGSKPASQFGRWVINFNIPTTIALLTPLHQASGLTPRPEFTWTADAKATSYEIEIATISNFSTIAKTITGITTASYTLSESEALDYQGGYYWRVRGVGLDGAGPWSTEERYFSVKPGPVTLVSPSDGAPSEVINPEFTWELLNSISKYDIEVSTDPEFSTTAIQERVFQGDNKSVGTIDINPTGTFTPTTSLDYNTLYYWRVRGEDNASTLGEWSAVRSFTTIEPVDQVSLLSPADNATSQPLALEFTWDSIEGATNYDFQIAGAEDFLTIFTSIPTGTITSANLNEAFLSPYAGATLYWRVRAKRNSEEGEWSESRSLTLVRATPSQVTLVSPEDVATDEPIRPTLSWQYAANSTRFDLQVSTSSDFGGEGVFLYEREDINALSKGVGTDAVPTLEHVMEQDLAYNTTYYWRVRGDNPDVSGEWSETRSFTTQWPVPAQVVLVAPENGSQNQPIQPTLSWQVGSVSESYELVIASSNTFAENTIVYTRTDLSSVVKSTETSGSDVFEHTVEGGLTFGSTFYWRVRAKHPGQTGAWSTEWSFTTLPGSPDQVVLQSPSDQITQVSLTPEFTWFRPDRGVAFELQVSTSMDFSTTVLDVSDLSELSYVPGTPLSYNVRYYWRVRSSNPGGEGEWSEPWSFTTQWPVPGVVTELLTPQDGSTGVAVQPTFSWTNIVYAEEYDLRVWDVSNPGEIDVPVYSASGIVVANKSAGAEISNGVTVEHTATQALENNTTYYWQVLAKNSTGSDEWSGFSSFTTIVPLPARVTLVSPENGATEVTRNPVLTWSAAQNAVSYEFMMDTSEAFDEDSPQYVRVPEATGTQVNFGGTPLLANTTYYWRVRASNAAGESPWSETWSFTTVRDLPAQVNLLYPNNDEVDIALRPEFKWSQAERADSYELQVSSNQDYSDPVISRNTRANLTYTPEADLDGVTRYWFRVRGINEQGPGPWSTPRSFVTKLDVPGKVFLRFPNNNSTGVSLTPEFTWSEVDGAESYHLQVSRNDGFGTTVIDKEGVKTTKVGFEQGNLQALTAYYFRVRAKNAKGYGEWSDVRGFVTKEAELAGNVTDIQVRQITTKQVVSKTHSVQSTAAFEISWTPPAFDGGTEIVDYRIVYRTADETTWTTYERPASTDTVAIVTGFESGVAYAFDVLAVNAVGAPEPTDDPPVVVSIETEEVPTEVTLVQNYPNPFNPATTIRFSLPVSSEVRLEVYSMLGQRLAVLVQGQQPAGWHTVTLDATSWASGTYIYRLQADGFTQTKKFLLVK